MNAFKACMLEDTMADSILMKESAYNVVSQDKDTIRSILEIENHPYSGECWQRGSTNRGG